MLILLAPSGLYAKLPDEFFCAPALNVIHVLPAARSIVSDLNLYVVIHFTDRPFEQSSCCLIVKVRSPAVVADFSGDVFHNDSLPG
jgi:hypothetical protein